MARHQVKQLISAETVLKCRNKDGFYSWMVNYGICMKIIAVEDKN